MPDHPEHTDPIQDFRYRNLLIRSIFTAANPDTRGSPLIADFFKAQMISIALHQRKPCRFFLLLRAEIQQCACLPGEMPLTYSQISRTCLIPQSFRSQPQPQPSLPLCQRIQILRRIPQHHKIHRQPVLPEMINGIFRFKRIFFHRKLDVFLQFADSRIPHGPAVFPDDFRKKRFPSHQRKSLLPS